MSLNPFFGFMALGARIGMMSDTPRDERRARERNTVDYTKTEPPLPVPLTATQTTFKRLNPLRKLRAWGREHSFLVTMAGSAAICLWMTLQGPWGPGRTPGWGLFATGLSVVMVGLWLTTRDRFLSYEALDRSQCSDMEKLLSSFAGGAAFRQAVLAQGRAFTDADREQVKTFVRDHATWEMRLNTQRRDEAACRRLHEASNGLAPNFREKASLPAADLMALVDAAWSPRERGSRVVNGRRRGGLF